MKIAMIADLHFGIKKADPTFMESQLRFFREQFVPELNKAGITTIWILGDVFDTRQTINTMTINKVIELFRDTLKDFDINIIVGNHDMYLTTDTGINSLKILDLLPKITVYEQQTVIIIDRKKILVQPWIVDYKQENLITGKYDYCFCHADIVGFDMGGGRLSESGLVAKQILKTLGLRQGGVEVVSCPTCGRTQIDLIGLADRVENLVAGYDDLNVKVAVMGCVVNGPGEAKEADFGIAGGKGTGLLIRKGEVVKTLPEEELLPALKAELDRARAEQART